MSCFLNQFSTPLPILSFVPSGPFFVEAVPGKGSKSKTGKTTLISLMFCSLLKPRVLPFKKIAKLFEHPKGATVRNLLSFPHLYAHLWLLAHPIWKYGYEGNRMPFINGESRLRCQLTKDASRKRTLPFSPPSIQVRLLLPRCLGEDVAGALGMPSHLLQRLHLLRHRPLQAGHSSVGCIGQVVLRACRPHSLC